MLRTGSPAILKQRLKMIPFTHVNFSPEFNSVSCVNTSLVQVKKKFSIPTFLCSKKKSLPSLSKFLWL